MNQQSDTYVMIMKGLNHLNNNLVDSFFRLSRPFVSPICEMAVS